MIPTALTIAGSDPSGGAGLQADLKTFQQHGVFGMSAVTLLTVQNTRGVESIQFLSPEFVECQIKSVLVDIPPTAAKTGALGNRKLIELVGHLAKSFAFPLVVDPVMVSKHGSPLIDHEAAEAVAKELVPYAFVITPNLFEAEKLTGLQVKTVEQMKVAAKAIAELGAKHVLIKGGQLPEQATDILFTDGRIVRLDAPTIHSRQNHGSGCVLSAAITAQLAQSRTVEVAVQKAKNYVHRAIAEAPGLGSGIGPTNPFVLAD